MSASDWKLENDLCRCCHAKGSFTSLSESKGEQGVQEAYLDMLQNCLNVSLLPVEGDFNSQTNTICADCIVRLKDASEFKKQVLVCEEKFYDLYKRSLLTKQEPEVKVEITEVDEDFDDVEYSQINDNADEVFEEKDCGDSDTGDEQPILTRTRACKTKTQAHRSKKSVKKKESEKPKFRLRDEDYRKEGDVYHCTRCDKKYEKIFSLRFHLKSKHYKIPRFVCPYCEKQFMTLAPLTVHKLEEHKIDDRFNCNACKGTFNTKVQLRKHINNFHMMGERYKCEFCDYESFSFEGLYKHKFKHKTVKDYHCRFCRKSFLRKTTLDLHERIHTGDRRKVCKECGQAFVQKSSLNYHMTKYHPEVNF